MNEFLLSNFEARSNPWRNQAVASELKAES
jgi:hypothetical protein